MRKFLVRRPNPVTIHSFAFPFPSACARDHLAWSVLHWFRVPSVPSAARTLAKRNTAAAPPEQQRSSSGAEAAAHSSAPPHIDTAAHGSASHTDMSQKKGTP